MIRKMENIMPETRSHTIGVIAPDDEVALAVRDIAAAMQLKVELRVGFPDEAETIAAELERRGARILVCRGGVSKRLRESDLALPLIDIPISELDILALLDHARQIGEPVAVIGVDALLRGAQDIAPFLGIQAKAFPTDNEGGLPVLMARIRDAGFKVVVGPRQVVECATRFGLPALPVRSHKPVIAAALAEAKKLLEFLRREEEWSMRQQAAFNAIEEGILSFDRQGRILHCNEVAARMLDIGRLAPPHPMPESLREAGVAQALESGARWDGEIVAINRTSYVCTLHPVGDPDEPMGGVAAFQEVTSLQRLEHRVRRSLHRDRGLSARHHFSGMAPCGPLLRNVIAKAKNYAMVDSTVLIEGETGTGKEIFAQSMHNASPRAAGPFVAVSCSALPEHLLESELFGYNEGAFTGARKGGKAGLFELAHNGTMLLDEIGEIPMPVQAKLLRVLEERTVMRLGDDRLIPVNVRVICATNRRLAERVKEGLFREDLYYRINVLHLTLPPLRERDGDVLPTLDFFLEHFSRELGRPPPRLDKALRERLAAHRYSGNMRELRNTAERLVVTQRDDGAADASALDELWDGEDQEPAVAGTLMQREEYRLIHRMLEETGGNRSAAARRLGMSPSTLWRKLKAAERGTAGKRSEGD